MAIITVSFAGHNFCVAVNGTRRLPDALAPLINVRSGAEGDKQTPNVTKCGQLSPTYM